MVQADDNDQIFPILHFFRALVSLKKLKPSEFASLEWFYNPSDTAHRVHIRRLLELAPNARFIDMFGSSELGMSQFYKTAKHDSKFTYVRSGMLHHLLKEQFFYPIVFQILL